MKPIALILGLVLTAPALADDAVSIAFGSCLRQWHPAPVFEAVRQQQPAAFVFTGDNVYADAGPFANRPDPERISAAYRQLGRHPNFMHLKSAIPLYATWDDHDYGVDNAGAEYRYKEAAKRAFLEFFEVAPDSPLRQRPGVYAAHFIGEGKNRIQLILLDTRSFRGPLEARKVTAACPGGGLVGTRNTQTTILGEAQWRWLAVQLQQPAALRLVVSSIQVIPDRHCREKWGNFPHERARLIELLRSSNATRTILISGDRHFGEISKLPGTSDAPPLYEITASGLNFAGAGKGEVNPYRVTADNIRVDHFGSVRLVQDPPGYVELTLNNIHGRVLQRYRINYQTWLPLDAASAGDPR